jgi:pimeloyl-ACP methyl ester carboxylesterase
MATIDVDDTTIHYERAGRGPAVLFVHGICGDAEVWADQAQRFADSGHVTDAEQPETFARAVSAFAAELDGHAAIQRAS